MTGLNPEYAMKLYCDQKLLQSQAHPQEFDLTINWLCIALSLRERLILLHFFLS